MRIRYLLPVLLLMVIFGVVATPSSLNPLSENNDGWYDMHTGQVHCADKLVCLHEVVHKYDWENGNGQISVTKAFHKAVTEYHKEVYETPVDERTWFETYVYNFPGVGNEFAQDGWGGHHELYAEIFRVSVEYRMNIPDEFEQFYDKEAIYKLWEQYPNFWSMW